MLDNIFWDLGLGPKYLRQGSEMTLPRGSVSDSELVCLGTAPSLLQTLPRRLSQNPSSDRSQVPIFAVNVNCLSKGLKGQRPPKSTVVFSGLPALGACSYPLARGRRLMPVVGEWATHSDNFLWTTRE